MAKPVQVQLSFIAGRHQKLIDLGRDHRMQTTQGTLNSATISMNLIDYLIDLRHTPEIEEALKREGGTLLDLIQRALHWLLITMYPLLAMAIDDVVSLLGMNRNWRRS